MENKSQLARQKIWIKIRRIKHKLQWLAGKHLFFLARMIFGFIDFIIVYETSAGVSMAGEWKVFFRKKDLDSYDIDFQSEWCCF